MYNFKCFIFFLLVLEFAAILISLVKALIGNIRGETFLDRFWIDILETNFQAMIIFGMFVVAGLFFGAIGIFGFGLYKIMF